MDSKIKIMLDFLTTASDRLEEVLQECKPDTNDLQHTLEYDRRVAQMKEIKTLIKKLKDGTK